MTERKLRTPRENLCRTRRFVWAPEEIFTRTEPYFCIPIACVLLKLVLRLLLLLQVGILSLSLFTFIYFPVSRAVGATTCTTVPDLIRWEQHSSSILSDVFIRKITTFRGKNRRIIDIFPFNLATWRPFQDLFFFFKRKNCTKNESK